MIPTLSSAGLEVACARRSAAMEPRHAARAFGGRVPQSAAALMGPHRRFRVEPRAGAKARSAPAAAGKTQVPVRAKAYAPWVLPRPAHAPTAHLRFECAVLHALGATGRTVPLRLNARWVKSIVKAARAAAAAAWRSETEPASVASGEPGAASAHARGAVASAQWARPTRRLVLVLEAAAVERVRAPAVAIVAGEGLEPGAGVQAAHARRIRHVPVPMATPVGWNAAQTAVPGLAVHPRRPRGVFESVLGQAGHPATTSVAARREEVLGDGSSACPPALGRRRAKHTAARPIS